MNNATRKQIESLRGQVENFKDIPEMVEASEAFELYRDACTRAAVKMEELKARAEELRDEEQEKFDNMPEGLQQGENGQKMEAAISSLDSAVEAMDSIVDGLGEEDNFYLAEDLQQSISEASDALGSATD